MRRFRVLLAALLAAVALSATAAPASAAPSTYPASCPAILATHVGCVQHGWGSSTTYVNWANAEHALVYHALNGYLANRFRQYLINYWGASTVPIHVYGTSSTFNHGNNRVHVHAYVATRYGDVASPWTNVGAGWLGGVYCHVSGDISGTDYSPSLNLVEHGIQVHGCQIYNNYYNAWGFYGAPTM